MVIFNINFLNLLFGDFDLNYLSYFLKVSNILTYNYMYVLFSLIVSVIGLIILESKGADKVIRQIGQIGTGVLAGIGGTDSILNLYDRFKDSTGGSSSGDNSDNSKGDESKDDKSKDVENKDSENNGGNNGNLNDGNSNENSTK